MYKNQTVHRLVFKFSIILLIRAKYLPTGKMCIETFIDNT